MALIKPLTFAVTMIAKRHPPRVERKFPASSHHNLIPRHGYHPKKALFVLSSANTSPINGDQAGWFLVRTLLIPAQELRS
jgi:hypothetical protein